MSSRPAFEHSVEKQGLVNGGERDEVGEESEGVR